MTIDGSDSVRKHFAASRAAIDAALADNAFVASVAEIARAVEGSLRAGGKVLLAGNGGSAADAQHIAGELVGRFKIDRPALAALALTTDSAVLTAVGNDYGYEQVFARQVRGLGRPGDLLIALSTSGKSPNILRAVDAAKEIGLRTVAFTGNAASPLADACELALRAPSGTTALIQQVHMVAAHAICDLVETAFAARR